MLLIQCTRKLASDVKPNEENDTSNDPIYSWHAHIFIFNRRKYALVMNNKTRYNFVIGSLKKAEFNKFNQLIKLNIKKNLSEDGFSQSIINDYIQHIHDVCYSKTSERSIISQINVMIMSAKDMLQELVLNESEIDLTRLNRYLNRFVMLELPEVFSVDAMKKELGQ